MSDLVQRRARSGPTIDFQFDRDPIAARAGDTVALTLLGAGVMETSRSIKYRRPRGAYCLRGDCGSCLVRIDGRPNERTCITEVTEHMRVESQNRLVETGPDPSGLVDRVLRGGMDHHHFMVRPKIANQIMQGVARGLTGLGTLPDQQSDELSPHRRHTPDVLIIGGGPAGHGVVEVIERAPGVTLLWLDRRPRARASERASLLADTGVFGVYSAEGLISAMTRRGRGAPVLHTIVPRHVVYATGATDPTIAVPNNDLPGVVAARGLLDQLRRSDATLSCEVVVVGRGPLAESAAAALACAAVDPDAVTTILGGSHAEGVQTKQGKVRATLVALAPGPSPAYELARQGGADLRWDGAGFAVVRDDDGRCESDGPWTSWVCGDAAGYNEAAHANDPRPPKGTSDPTMFGRAHDAAAHADGQRVGNAIVASLRGGR